MKKIIKTILVSLLLAATSFVFAATKKSIVCTTFPQYDWTLNILGEKTSDYEITLLQNNGTDLHSFQPSFKDIAKISTCDLFIYIGGESDVWVAKVLSDAKNKKMIVVNLMEALGDKVREEEIVEGMQAEECEEEEEDEPEYDEHIWLSLRNAIDLTKTISTAIQKLDGANTRIYKSNADSYIQKLSALDSEYVKTVESAKSNTILFGDRFPFRYMTDDYGIKYYAVFTGCSAESEVSFETITFMAKKVDELKLPYVITLEKSDNKIARTIINSTKTKKQQILQMDSLQSITKKDISNKKDYLSSMRQNLEVLKKALN